MTLLEGLFVALIVAPTTVWCALAIGYHVRSHWLRWDLPVGMLLLVAVGLWLPPVRPWALAAWFGVVVGTILWFRSLRPRSDRDWAIGMDVLPDAEVSGDIVRIRNFRNFDYTASGDPLPRYEERNFDLTKLSSLDYILAHWEARSIAHSMVSFGFNDGQYLVLSVEARFVRGQPYSPLRGMFRYYEIIFLIGDERDIIRVRTNIRREHVYLYPVRMPLPRVRQLLEDYLARARELAHRPEWYNSVSSNCTTNLFYHAHHHVPWWLRLNIFVNGLSPRALYLRGFLDKSLPYRELKSRSEIGERALAEGDAADYSQRIRSNLDLVQKTPL
jgi:hypothetical protein